LEEPLSIASPLSKETVNLELVVGCPKPARYLLLHAPYYSLAGADLKVCVASFPHAGPQT
jgi:hypothetical protein